MKILFVADLHYALKQFDWLMSRAASFDAVIIGGDLLDLGSALDLDVQIVVVEKYLAPPAPVDARARQFRQSRWRCPLRRRRIHLPLVARNQVRPFVRRRRQRVDWRDARHDLSVVGWAGFAGELEILLQRDAAKAKAKWIWVHHAPPDKSPVSWAGKKFGGDEFLVEWIRRYQPELVLSGHIHNAPFVSQGSWIDRLGRTWVFNPGKQIGPQPTYLLFDLEQMNVEWVSLEGQVLQQLDIPFNAVAGAAGGA